MPTRRDVAVLLLMCAAVCASIEGTTALLFRRMSRIENRREAEFERAVAMRSARDHREVSVLVVGNSLLLEGVDFSALQKGLGSGVELRRAVVENTSYLDWYYGLRRLFKMGSQPDVVVLVLNPIQLTSRSTDGDYAAHFLLDRQDLMLFANDLGADRNRLSSLALANVSFFYGTRAEIRSWILGRILPDLPKLTHLFHGAPAALDGETIRDIAAVRLSQLQQLCQHQGSDLIVVIPPSLQDSGANAILKAAQETSVRLLIPIAPGALPASQYTDGFHLNSQGAGKFTLALGEDLRQILSVTGMQKTRNASIPSSLSRADRLQAGVVPLPARDLKIVVTAGGQ